MREREDRDELFVSRLSKLRPRPRRCTYLSSTSSAWDFVNIPFASHRCIDCRWSPLVIRRRYTKLGGSHTPLDVVLPNLNRSISSLAVPIRSFPNLISRCLCECILLDSLRILRHRILKNTQLSIFTRWIRSFDYLEGRDSARELVRRRSSTFLRLRTYCNDDFSRLESKEISSLFQRAKTNGQVEDERRGTITSSNEGERLNRVNNDQMAMAN